MKPFDVFICHKKSSGKDFAEHLKSGLDELGYHSFLDSKDIPKMVDGREEWIKIRDDAIKESRVFILVITPGFDLSQEVRNEIELARKYGKQFIYFRHRDLARKIVVDLPTEKIDLGKQEQVSFENKEELLRLAHGILLRYQSVMPLTHQAIQTPKQTNLKEEVEAKPTNNTCLTCEMCSKPIDGNPISEIVNEKAHDFDSRECAKTYKKLKSIYGENFE